MSRYAFLLFSAILLLSGCVQSNVFEPKTIMGVTTNKPFPAIEGAKLELAVAGNPELVCGRDKPVTFILRNLSPVPINIPEWYTHEPDNIEVSCQIWFPNQQFPVKNRWVTYPVILKQPATHYPMRIGGKMFITIDVPLEFLDHLIVKPGTERRYFIKARLNLTSVKAESKPTSIIIKAK